MMRAVFSTDGEDENYSQTNVTMSYVFVLFCVFFFFKLFDFLRSPCFGDLLI